jgi:Tfp pilus assembly protein PilF
MAVHVSLKNMRSGQAESKQLLVTLSNWAIAFFLCLGGVVNSSCQSSKSKNLEKAHIHLKLGTAMFEEGRYPQALVEFQQSLRLDRRNPVTHNNLALVYLARERADLAEQHFKEALRLRPDYTEARINLASVEIDRGSYRTAQELLEVAGQDLTFPRPERVHYLMGLIEFRQKNFTKAIARLMEALKLKRTSCEAQLLLGRSYLELKQFRMANHHLERAVGFCRGPLAPEAQYYSAFAQFGDGKTAQAILRLEELQKMEQADEFRERALKALELMRSHHESIR